MGKKNLFFITFLPPGKKIIGGLDIFTNQLVEEMLQDNEFLKDYFPTLICFKGNGRRRKINNMNVIEFKYDESRSIVENNNLFKGFLNSQVKKEDIVITNDWFGIPSKGRRIGIIHSLEHHRSLILGKEEDYIKREERRAIESADEVITVSKLMAQEIDEYYAHESRVIYLSHSLPIPSSLPSFSSRSSTSEHEINILFVGRLERQKNVENLIKATSMIKEEPGWKIILNIIGKGSMEVRLKKYASYLKLNSVIKFLGWVSYKKLIHLYTTSHLFVLPSYFEPFGIACYDAYIYNLPIISTQKAGCLELLSLHHYKHIRTFDPFIPYSIAEAIEDSLLSTPTFKEKQTSKKSKKIRIWKEVWEEIKEVIYMS